MTKVDNSWKLSERSISSLEEQLSTISDLIYTLDVFSGQPDNDHSDASDSDGEGPAELSESEVQILARNQELIESLIDHFPSTTESSPTIKNAYKEKFGYYDSLYIMLTSQSAYFESVCRDFHGAPADTWLRFFLGKINQFAMQVAQFRDELNTLKKGRVSYVQMTLPLFELLVCLFLTPQQIKKLKLVLDPEIQDPEIYTRLDIISEYYDKDSQDNRRYIRRDESLEWLLTSVYMLHVDIVSIYNSNDFPSGWKEIKYDGYCCYDLLQFAKTETIDIQQQIKSLRGPWEELLHTIKDPDGESLRECTLCHENMRDVIVMPCKCFGACRACISRWRLRSNTCPFCRGPIQSIDSVWKHLDENKVIPFNQTSHLPKRDIFSLLTQLRCV